MRQICNLVQPVGTENAPRFLVRIVGAAQYQTAGLNPIQPVMWPLLLAKDFLATGEANLDVTNHYDHQKINWNKFYERELDFY